MAAQWYVLRSAAQKENILYKQLVSRRVESFFPRLRVKPVNPRAAKWRPLFPNYLFVRIDLQETGSSFFDYLPFSQGLVELGGEAAVVTSLAIQSIRDSLDEINAKGGLEFNRLAPGDTVQVTEGPFRGYHGIFDMKLSGAERVLILLNISRGKQIRTELPAGAVRKK